LPFDGVLIVIWPTLPLAVEEAPVEVGAEVSVEGVCELVVLFTLELSPQEAKSKGIARSRRDIAILFFIKIILQEVSSCNIHLTSKDYWQAIHFFFKK
jgi:hypothetical protein